MRKEKIITLHSESETERFQATKVILGFILVMGVIPLLAAAPGVVQLFGTYQKLHRRYSSPAYVQGLLKKLQNRGLVKVYIKNGKQMMVLTEKGKLYYAKLSGKQKEIKKKWDKKWRVVIFDITEKQQYKRSLVREAIKNFGFIRLQNSVWIYPYDCEELITLLKGEVKLGSELLYLVAGKVEQDEWLRKKFKLQ